MGHFVVSDDIMHDCDLDVKFLAFNILIPVLIYIHKYLITLPELLALHGLPALQ